MNKYGTQAQTHWRDYLPERYAQITNPETFFTEMGERAANEIADLEVQLAGEDSPGEGYLGKVGRLNNARSRAEEMVLREEVLVAPEKATRYDPELDLDVGETQTDQARTDAERGEGWIPLTEDPTHPYWQRKRALERNPDLDEQEVRRFVP